jgi:hypothetical protein
MWDVEQHTGLFTHTRDSRENSSADYGASIYSIPIDFVILMKLG